MLARKHGRRRKQSRRYYRNEFGHSGNLDIPAGIVVQNRLRSKRTNAHAVATVLRAVHDVQIQMMRTLHRSVATTFIELFTADAFS